MAFTKTAGVNYGTPELTLTTANAAGSNQIAIRNDASILTYDTTLPDAITYGQSGAVGTASTASRRDHAHGMAASDAVAQASQAEVEDEDNVDKYVPPDLIRKSPGVTKAWVSIASDGSLETPDYNISTVTDSGTGDRTCNFTTAMSSAVFAVGGTSLGDAVFIRNTARATGSFRIEVMNSGNSGTTDVGTTHIVSGDQS